MWYFGNRFVLYVQYLFKTIIWSCVKMKKSQNIPLIKEQIVFAVYMDSFTRVQCPYDYSQTNIYLQMMLKFCQIFTIRSEFQSQARVRLFLNSSACFGIYSQPNIYNNICFWLNQYDDILSITNHKYTQQKKVPKHNFKF